MSCANCSWTISETVGSLDRVTDADVNVATADAIKDSAAVSTPRERGTDVLLLTGDNERTARRSRSKSERSAGTHPITTTNCSGASADRPPRARSGAHDTAGAASAEDPGRRLAPPNRELLFE